MLFRSAVGLLQRVTEHLPGDERKGRAFRRLWQVRAREVVVATGATERPLVFADNDRPGVMLAAGVRGYLHRYGLAPERLVVFTADDDAYRTAIDLAGAGVFVAAVVDVRPEPDGPIVGRARALGIPVLPASCVVGTEGDERGVLSAVRVRPLDGGEEGVIETDCLAVSGGWDPLFDLHLHLSGGSRWDTGVMGFVPDGTVDGVRVVGAAAGAPGLARAMRRSPTPGWARPPRPPRRRRPPPRRRHRRAHPTTACCGSRAARSRWAPKIGRAHV